MSVLSHLNEILSTGTESFNPYGIKSNISTSIEHHHHRPEYPQEQQISQEEQEQAMWMRYVAEIEKQQWCKIYQIGITEAGGKAYMALLHDEISMLDEYRELISCIYDLNSNDILTISIASPGGYIATATQICSAMCRSKGLIITHATGICASAGSLIWSCGHKCIVGDYANFMWHMSSHMDFGCSLSIRDEAQYQITYVKDVLLKIALTKGFITEEEIDRICNDPLYCKWISASEMRKRVLEFEKKKNGDSDNIGDNLDE